MEKETIKNKKRKESQSQEYQSKPRAKKGDGKSKKDTRKWFEFHKNP
jgi:hypothetical protein